MTAPTIAHADNGQRGLPPPDDSRVIAALEEYVQALEAGNPPSRAAFLARHANVAAALAACLDGLDFVHVTGHELAPKSAAEPVSSLEGGGSPLGDFRILREVGRGGMGVVYEAEQISLGRRVALKVLPFASTLDPKQLQRFKNEAQAAAHLHHQNIVPVHATGCERGVHYYAMQFIEGHTLADVIADARKSNATAPLAPAADGPATMNRADAKSISAQETAPNARLSTLPATRGRAYFHALARLGAQAAEALDYSHELGVIHRDIKPANMLLDDRGKLWVTDFGLAHCQTQAGLTMTGDLVGTLRYMSPEQALAKRVIVDHRTDIYSLGATLYELVALQPVYQGGDRQELLRQIAFDDPKPTRRHNPAIPVELDTIILKALEKNPTDRYATAKEMADDLQRFVKDEPIRARPPSLARRVRNMCRRHKPVVWSTAVILAVTVAMLAGTIGWAVRDEAARQAETDRLRAITEQAVAEDLKEAENWLQQEKLEKAVHALERAKVRLGSGLALLQARVRERLRDVALIARLHEARLNAAAFLWGDPRQGDQQFRAVFAELGLDIDSPDIEKTASQIRASALRNQLVIALDNRRTHGNSKAIVRLADDDPWRQQVRDLAAAKNGDALLRLAEAEETLAQPPDSLLLLTLHLTIPAGVERDSAIAKKYLATRELFLRQAQQRYPADFWLNYWLGGILGIQAKAWADAVGFVRAALALQPQSPGLHKSLGDYLGKLKKHSEAAAAYRKAIEYQPIFPDAYHNLGIALQTQGKWPKAVDAFQKAIEQKPTFPDAYFCLGIVFHEQRKWTKAVDAFQKAIEQNINDPAEAYQHLGTVFREQGELPKAIAAHQMAIKLKSDYAEAHNGLGTALARQSKLTEAEAAFRKAIDLKRDYSLAYRNLGVALGRQSKHTDAEAAFREAIKLKPHSDAYRNLGVALEEQNKFADAEEAFRKAIDLKDDFAEAYHSLGIVLEIQRKLEGAEGAFRMAIKLNPNYTSAYGKLSSLLWDNGQFAECLPYLKRAHDLSTGNPDEERRFAARLQKTKQWVRLDADLPNFISGKTVPMDAAECVALGSLCQHSSRQFYAAAARFYSEAFAAQPKLAHDLTIGTRYDAACVASLAGCRQGKGAANLDPKECTRLRTQALTWLRADLSTWQKSLEEEPDKARPRVWKAMQHWQRDADFNGVRGEAALAKLPDGERQEWHKLWQEVAELDQRAAPSQPR